MHDLIIIKGLRFDCIVGINPPERINPQPLQLDLEIGTDISIAAATEDIRSTVDYGEIAIGVDLGLGNGRATFWTCDLTPEYVHLNADYTT